KQVDSIVADGATEATAHRFLDHEADIEATADAAGNQKHAAPVGFHVAVRRQCVEIVPGGDGHQRLEARFVERSEDLGTTAVGFTDHADGGRAVIQRLDGRQMLQGPVDHGGNVAYFEFRIHQAHHVLA